jgi:hypothetical protein
MPRYLLVDDTDGRVLAELASPELAMRVLARLAPSPGGDPHVSLVRLDHHQGDLIGVDSRVAMRPLAPPGEHSGRREASPFDRIPLRTRRRRRWL